jgi:DNA ligase 1
MKWITTSRLLELTEDYTPTNQVNRMALAIDNKDIVNMTRLLSLDFEENQLGHAKGIKFVAKCLDIFDDEVSNEYSRWGDLGTATKNLVMRFEPSEYNLRDIISALSIKCASLEGRESKVLQEMISNMNDLEAKWFIRYLVRKTGNNIGEGTVKKILAKKFGKKVSVVKKHLNFWDLPSIARYYSMNEEPPMVLSHGTFVKPMLAKEIPMEKWPKDKIVDYKYDGNRYQIHKEGDNVIIFNRKGKVATQQFQDVVETVRQYEIDCILDGEIYPINEDGSPAEHKLMATRVHSKDHAEAREKVKVKWVIFDCLKIREETIMDLTYAERLVKFCQLPDQAHRMDTGGDVLAFYNRAISDGFEGIIVKDISLPYEAGKRSAGWAKYKPPRIELDVVILSAKYGKGTRNSVFASFEIGVKSNAEYVSVGHVGTGFSESDLDMLTRKLKKNVDSVEDGKFNLLPREVLEVSADLVSCDAKGNYGLRFPRCKRIRDDKHASEVDTYDTLVSLA